MIKNRLFFLVIAVALQACGGKEIEFEANLDLICASQSFNAEDFKVKSIDYGRQLQQLEVQLATVKEEYSSDDVCIPFSVVVTNTGTEPLQLTSEQLAQLNGNSLGFYGEGARVFEEPFFPVKENPVLNGEPWLPGAQLELAAFIDLDRIKLYTPTHLINAQKVWDASFQGPSPLLGITAINAPVTINPHESPVENYRAQEVIVSFYDSVDIGRAEAVIAESGCAIKGSLKLGSSVTLLVAIPPQKSISAMIDYFELDSSVKYAMENDIVTLGRP